MHPAPNRVPPLRMSRTKLELFLRCPRCFYLDRALGVPRPSSPPLHLHLAVDLLLKREFDAYRGRREAHPLMAAQGVDAVPLDHPDLAQWRDSFRGVQYAHPETGIVLFGAVDDLWVAPDGTMFVVDYKATSAERPITLDGAGKDSYKRQLEIYQWLLRRNGFSVSSVAYLVFANADRQYPALDGLLHMTLSLHPYIGDDAWVDDALMEAHLCLQRESPPQSGISCDWCAYREAAGRVETNAKAFGHD